MTRKGVIYLGDREPPLGTSQAPFFTIHFLLDFHLVICYNLIVCIFKDLLTGVFDFFTIPRVARRGGKVPPRCRAQNPNAGIDRDLYTPLENGLEFAHQTAKQTIAEYFKTPV